LSYTTIKKQFSNLSRVACGVLSFSHYMLEVKEPSAPVITLWASDDTTCYQNL